MSHTAIVALGLVAGLHAALYGAYKDSPHESFLVRRFVREITIAFAVAVALVAGGLDHGQTPFILLVSVFALSRIVTEFWKLFLRVEPQGGYRIPTQVHVMRRVPNHAAARLALGLGWLGSIYGCYGLFKLLPDGTPGLLEGVVVGFGIGLATAISGGYKDGLIEGFSWRKFAKSPTFGTLGGLIAAWHGASLPFLLLASIGTERMVNELFFKILRHGYVPGKFRSMIALFPDWMRRRRYFLAPYAATWALYVILLAGRGL